jgi:hypothetical protein
VSTSQERDAARRKQKLEDMQEQIKSGSLTVRKMTDEERAQDEARRKPRPKRAPRG